MSEEALDDGILDKICHRAAKHIFRELCDGNGWPEGMTIRDGIRILKEQGYPTLGDNHQLVEKLLDGNEKCKGPLIGKLLALSPAIHPAMAEVCLEEWLKLLRGELND